MPVYGKGRVTRKQKLMDNAEIIRRPKIGRQLQDVWVSYNFKTTPLWTVQKKLRFPLEKFISNLIKKSSIKPVVVDWGCGKGTAITEIAEKFGGRIKSYGFGDISYNEWKNNDQVKLIHGTSRDFGRYFKDGTVDVIYSHYGLFHLGKRQNEYLGELMPKLKIGGVIVANVSEGDIKVSHKEEIILGGKKYVKRLFPLKNSRGEIDQVIVKIRRLT